MVARETNLPADAADLAVAERQARFPPTALDPRPCDGCEAPTDQSDFRVARWVRYQSRGGLVTVLAALAGAIFVSHTATAHATYHWLCPACRGHVWRQRLAAGGLRFLGLFLAVVGLGASAYLAAMLLVMEVSPRDRATAESSLVPAVAGLAVGLALLGLARLVRLPGALGRLDCRPFHLQKLFKSDPAKLAELQADYPDLYGLPSR